MTKRFCDWCEKPAIDVRRINVALPWGEKYVSTNKSVDPEMTQPMIELGANFRFTGHPSGFGGPPDLCKECTLKLVHLLASEVQGMKEDA